ncbi:MAG: SDR family NAD(P)-dependent oxidoreductase [Eubacteriales bacterium]|nr:SDR family NAD(P)-dependent oxidoreductase [Eubacteriales bacterium]
MWKRLDGKTALVTGAARGLGRAYAIRLAELGANVGVIDIDLKSYQAFEGEAKLMTAETTMDEVRALGVKSAGAEADITNREQVFAAVKKIEEELGPIDIVVCNAGGGMGAPDGNKAADMNWEQFYAVTERNYYGTVYTCNAVVPGMMERGYGKVINVISVGGLVANSDGSYAHYASAKAAIKHYTMLLAQQAGRHNVTVNAIAPGFIATGRLVENYKKAGEGTFLRNVAMKRFGTVEDCANVIEFLATDLSSYVNGAVIEVTGGTVGRMIMNEPSEA